MERKNGRSGSTSNRMILIHSNVSNFFKRQHNNMLDCFEWNVILMFTGMFLRVLLLFRTVQKQPPEVFYKKRCS